MQKTLSVLPLDLARLLGRHLARLRHKHLVHEHLVHEHLGHKQRCTLCMNITNHPGPYCHRCRVIVFIASVIVFKTNCFGHENVYHDRVST